MANIKKILYRFWYSDGSVTMPAVFTLDKILNGAPFEVTSDMPLMKGYKMSGSCDRGTEMQDEAGQVIFIGDIVEVCVFFVSPENPDEDFHFRGLVTEENGIVNLRISHMMYKGKDWHKISKTTPFFPFDKDCITDDGFCSISLFHLCALSGNLGEYNPANVTIIGNMMQNSELL